MISKIQLHFQTCDLVTGACYLSAHMYGIKSNWCMFFLFRVFVFLSYLWILVWHVPHCCANKHFGFGFGWSFMTTSCKIIWISGYRDDMFKIKVIPCVYVIWLYLNNVPVLLCFVEFCYGEILVNSQYLSGLLPWQLGNQMMEYPRTKT